MKFLFLWLEGLCDDESAGRQATFLEQCPSLLHSLARDGCSGLLALDSTAGHPFQQLLRCCVSTERDKSPAAGGLAIRLLTTSEPDRALFAVALSSHPEPPALLDASAGAGPLKDALLRKVSEFLNGAEEAPQMLVVHMKVVAGVEAGVDKGRPPMGGNDALSRPDLVAICDDVLRLVSARPPGTVWTSAAAGPFSAPVAEAPVLRQSAASPLDPGSRNVFLCVTHRAPGSARIDQCAQFSERAIQCHGGYGVISAHRALAELAYRAHCTSKFGA
ncbi:hypothetical protein PAPYR_834 [Paratrimastix pyriformis]|uniref:Uncharacterized protein n=1 Tax=Paratrimastix pyriformis TaxID=342808 RepID=A0ABQ8UUK7_9EUKA|nr:hypothetical protein PAPYR_834 [Paratrimastix pyriformis]